jgi:DNA polymerase-3 subunit gamma/tau
MRDALSLLDQIMTCSEGPVTHEQALNILGVVDRQVIFDLADALLIGDVSYILATVETAYNRGQDLKKLYADLLNHIRNLMVIKMADAAAQLVDLPASEIQRLRDSIASFSSGALNQVFALLYREEALVRLAAQPRLAVEMVLMQICQSRPALPVDDLIASVESLRQALIASDGVPALPNAAGPNPEGSGKPPSGETGDASSPPAATPPSAAPMALPTDAQARTKAWESLVHQLAEKMPALAASLKAAQLVAADDHVFEIEVSGNEFSINRIKRRESVAAISHAVKKLFGQSVEIVVRGQSNDPAARMEQKNREDRIKQQALGHPMVSEVVERFQGKVVDVKILSSEEKG